MKSASLSSGAEKLAHLAAGLQKMVVFTTICMQVLTIFQGDDKSLAGAEDALTTLDALFRRVSVDFTKACEELASNPM